MEGLRFIWGYFCKKLKMREIKIRVLTVAILMLLGNVLFAQNWSTIGESKKGELNDKGAAIGSKTSDMSLRLYRSNETVNATAAVEPGVLVKKVATTIELDQLNQRIQLILGRTESLVGVGIEYNLVPNLNNTRTSTATLRDFDPNKCNIIGFTFTNRILRDVTLNNRSAQFRNR